MALRDVLADIAAALALLSGARLIAAIAALLLGLVPKRLRDEEPELSAELAERVAKDVASLDIPDAYDGEQIRRNAARDALHYRAEYAANAVGRLSQAVISAGRGKRREALSRAYKAERRYFEAHRKISDQRRRAAETVAAQVAQYQTTRFVWRHAATRVPAEPRPSHKRADGKTFDISEGLPRGPGVLPGVLAGCTCKFEPA